MSKGLPIDLEQKQLALLKKILKRYIPNKSVWAYGSRVSWKADERSDIDLAIFGCTPTEISELKEALEESDLLISVDVMDWESIPTEFQENIRKKYLVLQEKTELEGWREVRLGEVAEVIGGFAFKGRDFGNEGEAVIKITELQPPYINLRNCQKIDLKPYTLKNLEKYKVQRGEYLVAMTGATIGKVGRLIENKVAYLNQRVAKVKAIEKYSDNQFIYYCIANNNFVAFIKNSATGAVQANISTTEIGGFPILLPPLPEQKAIAEALTSLDDKIDLLRRQNKTLEDMAQALFRKCFIEDADEGREEGKLGETVDISIGRTPPRKESQWFSVEQENWNWISIKDMANDGVYLSDTSEYLTQEAVRKFRIPVIPENTVLLSFKMTVGRVKITTKKMLSNEAIAHFKFRSDTPYSVEYLYSYLKAFNFESLGSTSSIVTSINTEMIKSLMIAIPDMQLNEEFKSINRPFFQKIFSNQSQIRTLEKLRDMLLPKLMSGEVRVEDY